MGSTGKDEVAKCVDHVLDYYISQSSAENHLVREVFAVIIISPTHILLYLESHKTCITCMASMSPIDHSKDSVKQISQEVYTFLSPQKNASILLHRTFEHVSISITLCNYS